MSNNETKVEFKKGGQIVILSSDGASIHLALPVHLGNEVSAINILPGILEALSERYGPIESETREVFGEPDSSYDHWELDLFTAKSYHVERRSHEFHAGASGAVEQIIIGLAIFVGYDGLKWIAKQAREHINRETAHITAKQLPSKVESRIQEVLEQNFGVQGPLSIEFLQPEDETQRANVQDSMGSTFLVSIDRYGVVFVEQPRS